MLENQKHQTRINSIKHSPSCYQLIYLYVMIYDICVCMKIFICEICVCVYLQNVLMNIEIKMGLCLITWDVCIWLWHWLWICIGIFVLIFLVYDIFVHCVWIVFFFVFFICVCVMRGRIFFLTCLVIKFKFQSLSKYATNLTTPIGLLLYVCVYVF